jgi:hypothetical protein
MIAPKLKEECTCGIRPEEITGFYVTVIRAEIAAIGVFL